jgi:hypothetical protein
MPDISYFLVTGMARSGTTLLEKLLCNHPEIGILSQPFPFLYRELKKAFFRKIDYPETYYVLSDLFSETRYTPLELIEFLEHYKITKKYLKSIFDKMDGWSGQLTDFDDQDNFLSSYIPQQLAKVYQLLVVQGNYNQSAKVVGTKEIIIEEFITYYLQKKIKVIHIVRDPRDVYTSINYGKGVSFAGQHRPSLFHLRNWRKSIYIGLTYQNNPNFITLKYEDLIDHPIKELNRIAQFLEIDPFNHSTFRDGIKDQQGKIWKGNSSTDNFDLGISVTNKNKYQQYLSNNTVKYVEYMTWPEMLSYGYEPYALEDPLSYDPNDFSEPFKIAIDDLDVNMSSNETQLKLEKKRLENLIKSGITVSEIKSIYYSEKSFEKLCAQF